MLGPLEVEDGGRQVALGGPKPRALLAILLLSRGEVVPTEELIGHLYGEVPPETSTKSVHAHVSRLRKSLGDNRLRTAGGGYALDVTFGEVDLDRFERLVERGRSALAAGDAEPAASSLREALALWRGPPYADFRYEDFAQAEIAGLEERRLGAVEDRIEADLALGRHADLVPELESLVAEHPLREGLRRQLMLALYRSGRQAEALEAYREARRVLVDELGIEPGRPLRDLQQAILEQSERLDLEGLATGALRSSSPEGPAAAPVAAVKASGRTGRSVRKTVTALHVDVAASSHSGEPMDPEVLRSVLGSALDEIRLGIEAHEGSVEAISLDSVSALFGLPAVHEDDPQRAVRAADDIRNRLRKLALELEAAGKGGLETRIGVSTGEVVTSGAAGGPSATGAPLGTAARLAQQAEADAVSLDERSRQALGATRDDSRFTSPMVGRGRERDRLRDAFAQAVGDASCQLFTVLGPPGVGKSRLVREFLGDVADDALIARGRCLPYGEGITYWPVVEAVRDAGALDEAASLEQTLERIHELIAGEDDAELLAQRVGEVIGLSEHVSTTEDTFWAIRQFFEALARRGPLVLVFDDIHWGESTFLDLVDHVADWSRDVPLLLVCVARPELHDAHPHWSGGKSNATSILLEPLSEAESTQLVENLVGPREIESGTLRQVVDAAGGNPLFVEELLAFMLEDRSGRLEIPPNMHALLAARLDRLYDEERATVEAAAVEGMVFHETSVAELTATDVSQVRSRLLTLVRKEFVRPDRPVFAGERAYRFRHLLIRDAAYDSIPKGVRAELHEAHSAWLEERASDRSLEFEEILGYHLEQAYRYRVELGPADELTDDLGRRAAGRLGEAGQRAFARGDAPAALNLIARAAALLPPADPARLDLVPNVRVMQGSRGDFDWAERILAEAVETGDARLHAHAAVQRGFLQLFTGADVSPTHLIETAESAIGTLASPPDDLGLARAWRLIAQAHYLARRAGPSAEASEHALVHARRAASSMEEVETVQWLSVALFLGPHPAAEAERRSRLLLGEVEGNPALEVHVLGALAYLVAMQARYEEAERLLERGRRLVERLGEGWHFPAFAAWLGLWHRHPKGAEEELRAGYEILKQVGERAHFCTVASLLARIAYAEGRFDEAHALTAECEEASRPNDVECQIHWRGTRAKVLAVRGEARPAEALACEALSIAAASDFLSVHGDALLDLADVHRLVGAGSRARPLVAQAIDLYSRKGDVASVERAEMILSRLRAEEVQPAS